MTRWEVVLGDDLYIAAYDKRRKSLAGLKWLRSITATSAGSPTSPWFQASVSAFTSRFRRRLLSLGEVKLRLPRKECSGNQT